MIVYNVLRRFFALKEDAERYRIANGLKPAATTKLEVSNRDELAALLDCLADPPHPGAPLPAAAKATGLTAEIVDDAFFDPNRDIPKFLRDDMRARGYPV